MSIYANKNLKRKFEDYGVNDEVRGTKEAKKGLTISEVDPSSERTLILRRLSPEDWVSSANFEKENSGESNVEECVKGTSVSRGVSWTGIDNISQIHGTSMQMSCSRFPSGESSYDCETQTYYFVPKPFLDVASTSSASAGKIKEEKNTYVEESVLRVCCVRDCESWSAEQDSSVTFYPLPSNSTEKSHWADILKVEFIDVPEHAVQEICSRHFIASESTPRTCKTTFTESKSSSSTKSRMKKKKTCDILIAEEAERVKQSMVTGRPKRTPKPNRNYDWAEIIPLIKNEADDMEELEVPVAKTPVKLPSGQGRRRKQHLEDPTKEKENEEAFIEVHVGLTSVPEINDIGFEDYGADISLPSMPRAPPPKPKGRPPRIQDTCTQTDEGLCSNRGPLREVKVQCNLTAEPLVTCSSCSYIDWKRLDEQLSGVIAVVEGDLCNPVIARCLRKILSLVTLPSHATNVIKLIAGLERDVLESGKGKDIVLVSSQDDWEEVEIENVIHQEEAPICGVREIIPKVWNKGSKVTREMRLTEEESTVDDPDSLGLREATDKDEEEFKPDLAELELEEAEDDMGGLDDDDDWDINNEDQSGAPVQKKKKSRQKTKKGTGRGNPPGAEKINHSENMPSRKKVLNKSLEKNRCQVSESCNKVPQSVSEVKPLFRCDDCGKGFTQRQAVRYHRVWRHNAKRLGPCPYCSYKAPDATKLKVHIKKVHYGFMPYKCRFCSKGFKCHSNHKEHEARHQGIGNFSCKFCSKKFAILSTLERHEWYHFEKRPFVCDYCKKGFKAKPHLERHIRSIHLKEKNIFCELCGKAHFNNWNLKMHMKTHEVTQEGVIRSCNICNCKFKNNTGLAAHMRKQHNITSGYLEEPKVVTGMQVQHCIAEEEDTHELISTTLTASASCSFDSPNYNEDDCQELGSQSSLMRAKEVTANMSASCVTAQRTFVIQDGSIYESKDSDNLEYSDFLEGSSMHSFELYLCNGCPGVFKSKEEFLCHEHTAS